MEPHFDVLAKSRPSNMLEASATARVSDEFVIAGGHQRHGRVLQPVRAAEMMVKSRDHSSDYYATRGLCTFAAAVIAVLSVTSVTSGLAPSRNGIPQYPVPGLM